MSPRVQTPDKLDRPVRWGVHTIPIFNKGLNSLAADELLEDEEVRQINNMRILQDRLVVDTGYVQIGGVTRGTPRKAFEHETVGGLRILLLITNATVYSYAIVPDEWHYISDGVDTTLSVAAVATDLTIDVVSDTGFSDGDFIGIILDDGTQHKTTVDGAPAANVITLDDAIPSAAAIGKAVVKAKDLNGVDANQVVMEAVPFEEWTVFTNGIDAPQRYDGSTVEIIPNLPFSGDTICKALVVFRNYLLLLGMTENSVSVPYNVRWSDNGDATNWSTNDAGFAALTETRDPIQGGKLLGRQLILHHTRSMTRVQFLTQGPSPFAFEGISFGKSAQAEGLAALGHNAIFALEDSHVFPTRKGVYEYPGGFTVNRISDNIFQETVESLELFNASKAFVQVSDIRDWLMLFLPGSGGDFPTSAIILNRVRQTWAVRTFPTEISFADIKTGSVGVRYIDLVGTMAEQTWNANTLTQSADAPTLLFGDATNLKVFKYDYMAVLDDATEIVGTIRTKLYRTYDRFTRMQWVELKIAAGRVILDIKSKGETISLLDITNSNAAFKTYRVKVDRELEEFEFTFLLLGTSTAVRDLSFKLRPASRLPW